jgi:hypothetical protein
VVSWYPFLLALHPSKVDDHLSQTGFTANLVEQFCRDSWEPTPTATSYCLGIPIDSIASSSNNDDSPSQLRWAEAYQSLIGSIVWLATATRLDLTPVHLFLLLYNSKPSTGHMKAALHVFTTFIPHTIMAFISRHWARTSFTPLCIFRILPMLRPIRTQNHLLPPNLLR